MNMMFSGLRCLPAGHASFSVALWGKVNRSNHYLSICAGGRKNNNISSEKVSNNPITSDDNDGGGSDRSSRSSRLPEILDLFKKIQSSISKRPKKVNKKKSSQFLALEMVDEIGDCSPESSKLDKLKVAKLKQLAKSKGLKGYSKLKKGELIQLLHKHL